MSNSVKNNTEDPTWKCSMGEGGSAFGYQWERKVSEFPKEFKGVVQLLKHFPDAVDICIITENNINIVFKKSSTLSPGLPFIGTEGEPGLLGDQPDGVETSV